MTPLKGPDYLGPWTLKQPERSPAENEKRAHEFALVHVTLPLLRLQGFLGVRRAYGIKDLGFRVEGSGLRV